MTSVTARQRLIDAAVEAFAEKGFTGTTTRDIAARAGMSPAAVYVHHDSKESLLYSVSLAGHQSTLAVIEQSYAATGDPVERVGRMVYDFTLWHAENSRVGRIVQYEFHALNPEHRQEIAGLRRSIEQCMRAALEAGVKSNALQIDDIPGTALALLSLGIDVVRWFDPSGTRTAEDLAELYARLAVRMVQAG
ncbi:MAG: TetR family transcriptional regulator [Propionibacteriales bacterium]|nr:TetR family transcriptional regulator [Propionibacteriales bacterium]